ncbi:VWA domain-containing protein [Chromatium okenii]|uniref:VWA domain-containing protein n=1 Tax=Chromatium okenii TaxID=61644 RepID=UPI0026ECFBCA|nr:VWA domain-containing protein [Chromatium okenii]
MKRPLLIFLIRQLSLLLVLFISTTSLCAAAIPPEVRLLIDVSGSMKENDPQNLRVPALRLVNELLPANAQAGVWLFAEKAEVLSPPSVVDDKWKNRTRSRLDRIHSRGLFTNIEQAINAGIDGWKPPIEETDRHLVLLTDGLVDVSKDANQSAASRERILSTQIDQLRELKVKVHAIALSDAVDTELLRMLTSETGGWFESAANADELQRIFLHMLEQTAAPTTVPLTGNRFQIDGQVSEFTLLAFRGSERTTALITPDGKTISATKPQPGALWREEEGYDLVTLTKPMPGQWQLQGVTDPDNRVVVVTDLGIELNPLPTALSHGAPLQIETWLTDHGKMVTRSDLLQLVTATATLTLLDLAAAPAAVKPPPAGGHADAAAAHDDAHPVEHAEKPADKPADTPSPPATEAAAAPIEVHLELDAATSHFHTELETQLLTPGSYQLQVTLDSGTFKRQLVKRFKLIGAPLQVHYIQQNPDEKTPAAIIATVEFEADLVDRKSLSGYLSIQGPPGLATVIDLANQNAEPLVLTIPVTQPGKYQVQARLLARTSSGEPIDFKPENANFTFDFAVPEATKTSADTPLSWLDFGLYLLIGNAALGLILGLTWWLLHRAKPAAVTTTVVRKNKSSAGATST